MCQLPLNKLHNGHLAALFLEVSHEEFLRRELEYTVGFHREEIQLSLISPREKFVSKGAKWKFKCLVGVAYLPVPSSCHSKEYTENISLTSLTQPKLGEQAMSKEKIRSDALAWNL